MLKAKARLKYFRYGSKAHLTVLKKYYRYEKRYLKLSRQYHYRYRYDFDQPNGKLRLTKAVYVYRGINFTHHNRITKLRIGTKVKVKAVRLTGKQTRLMIGHHRFITGLKTFSKKEA